MNKNLGPQILKLRAEGKTYNEIVNILGVNKATICYHCGNGQKEKFAIRRRKNRNKQHPYIRKVENFIKSKESNNRTVKSILNSSNRQLIMSKISKFREEDKNSECFTVEDVINKFGENPVCYLTGIPIDISQPRTYQFDHKIPRSRGGDSSINNLGICTKQANQAKSDMTPEEFLKFCKTVVDYNYKQ